MSLTEAQLEVRRSGITATDAVILAGCSNWGNPLEVWEAKMGAPPIPSTLAMEMGHAAEPVIMNRLGAEYGLKMWPGATVRHRIFPHFLATPDRFVHHAPIVVGPDGCLPEGVAPEATCEGKLVGWRLVKEWIDETDPTGKTRVFPDSVAVQTAWQMGCSTTRRSYVAALLGGWADEDYHHLLSDWNEDLWLALTEIGNRFWTDYVLTRKPPPPDSSDRAAESLYRIYPNIRRPILVPATDAQVERMRRYLEINKQIAALEEEKQAIGNLCRSEIGDAEGFKAAGLKATWRPQKGSVSAAAMADHFKLSEQALDTFRGEPKRVLRIAPLSKKEQAYESSIQRLEGR